MGAAHCPAGGSRALRGGCCARAALDGRTTGSGEALPIAMAMPMCIYLRAPPQPGLYSLLHLPSFRTSAVRDGSYLWSTTDIFMMMHIASVVLVNPVRVTATITPCEPHLPPRPRVNSGTVTRTVSVRQFLLLAIYLLLYAGT